MAPVRVAQFDLRVDLDTFLREFWIDSVWYERFLRETLGDRDISIGEWSRDCSDSGGAMVRDVRSYHPSKISFPGLPSFAESVKTQTYAVTVDDEVEHCAVLRETNNIRGIPYADYFCVNVKWDVVHKRQFDDGGGPSSSSSSSSSSYSDQHRTAARSPTHSMDDEMDGIGPRCNITVWLDFEFFKYTWLQGTIESNTQAELVGLFEQWQQTAEEHIRGLLCSGDSSVLVVTEVPLNDAPPSSSSSSSTTTTTIRTQPTVSSQGGLLSALGDDDGDVVFYDCVDGGPSDQALGGGGLSSGSLALSGAGGSWGDALSSGITPRGGGLSRTSSFSRDRSSIGPYYSSSASVLHRPSSAGFYAGSSSVFPVAVPGGPLTTRDVAVTLVETIFVVAEATFWRVHTIYRTDTRDLFNVAPAEVLARIGNALVPGRHGSALAAPDFYGPLLGVLLLPQILLLSIDVSLHGCRQTSMLGNATVVSLSLWAGLAVLYRLLALVIAPGLRFKHCLCVSGYSFFAWSLALLCSYPLEKHKSVLIVPVALPLVLFGIPAALAQGWLFWEHAPFASLTMQQALFPSSVQHFAQRHSRLLQKALWAVPKIAALIVVAGTHYQLLWYLARVFLPGRKHLCNLSALADRSQFSDVLSQKELRKYALMLVKGGE